MSLTTCVTYSCGCSSSREQLPCYVLEYIKLPQIKTKTMQCCPMEGIRDKYERITAP